MTEACASSRCLRAKRHVERQCQTPARAPGLEELVDVADDDVEPPGFELAPDGRRARRHDDGRADNDGVGAEGKGLVGLQDEPLGHQRLDDAAAVAVPTVGGHDRPTIVERAEREVEVVHAVVGQLDGTHGRAGETREIRVRSGVAAESVPGQQHACEGERVARALVVHVLG